MTSRVDQGLCIDKRKVAEELQEQICTTVGKLWGLTSDRGKRETDRQTDRQTERETEREKERGRKMILLVGEGVLFHSGELGFDKLQLVPACYQNSRSATGHRHENEALKAESSCSDRACVSSTHPNVQRVGVFVLKRRLFVAESLFFWFFGVVTGSSSALRMHIRYE